MSEIINERNSAPTCANETVTEKNKEASDPLSGATCSASSFSWRGLFKMIIDGCNPIKHLMDQDRDRRILEYRRANSSEFTLFRKLTKSHLAQHNNSQDH